MTRIDTIGNMAPNSEVSRITKIATIRSAVGLTSMEVVVASRSKQNDEERRESEWPEEVSNESK